jgi:ABC transporter transmembrane region
MKINAAATAAGVLAAFYHSPQLAAVLLSCVPLIGIPSALLARFSSRSTLTVQQRYSSAGAVAHEVITTVLQSSVHAQCSGNVRRIAFASTTTTQSDRSCLYTHCALLLYTQVAGWYQDCGFAVYRAIRSRALQPAAGLSREGWHPRQYRTGDVPVNFPCAVLSSHCSGFLVSATLSALQRSRAVFYT